MFFRNAYPALVWAVVILVLTLTPASDLPKAAWLEVYHVDKLIHIILFGVLYLLLMQGLMKKHLKELYNRAILWSIAIVILYGAAIEILQSVLPIGRSGDLFDWLADCAGAGIAYIIFGRWFRQKSISA